MTKTSNQETLDFQSSKSLKGLRARNSLVRAAIMLAGEKGIDALNISLVAEYAGIGRASFYHYFPTMDALLATIAQQTGEEIEESLEQAHGLTARGFERMATCLQLLMQRAVDDQDWGRFVARLIEYSTDSGEKFRSIIKEEVDAAIRKGESNLKPSEVPVYLQIVAASTFKSITLLARGEMKKTDIKKTVALLLRAGGMQ